MKDEPWEVALEKLIDTNSLSMVLAAIVTICAEKSEHVMASYSDKILASAWDLAAMKVADCEKEVREWCDL